MKQRRRERQKLIASLARWDTQDGKHPKLVIDNESIQKYMHEHSPISQRYKRVNFSSRNKFLDRPSVFSQERPKNGSLMQIEDEGAPVKMLGN